MVNYETKEDLFNYLQKEFKLTTEKFEELYKESYDFFVSAESPIAEKLALLQVRNKFNKQLLKKMNTKLVKYKGFRFGGTDVNDFGATVAYNKVMEQWNKADDFVKQQMIDLQMVEVDGNIVYPMFTEGVRKGKRIVLGNDNKYDFVICQKEESEDQPILRVLRLRKERTKINLPNLVPIEFFAQETNLKYFDAPVILDDDFTDLKDFYKVLDENKLDYQMIVDNYLENLLVTTSQMKDFIERNEKSYDKYCLFKGELTQINKNSSGRSVIYATGEDEKTVIQCWAGEKIAVNIVEGVTAYLFGKPYITREGNISLNLYGILTDQNYYITEKPQKVTPEKNVEVEEELGNIGDVNDF